MNLILLAAEELQRDGSATVSDERATHLIKVLKVAPGDRVRIGLIDGALGTGTIRLLDLDRVTLDLAFEAPPAMSPVDLLLALPRPKVLRRLWAQLAAIGVGRVMLTNAEKVERNYFDAHALDPSCYRPLLIEGLQQARDTRVPTVTVHRQLKVLIEDDLDRLCPTGTRLMADVAVGQTIDAALTEPSGARLLLAVGPEGGWNDFERRLLTAHGFHPIGLGPRTLRSDTACIALLAVVHDALRRRAPAG